MEKKELERKIIEQYQQDEEVMILVFAQWCINNDLNPEELYLEAYPNQPLNKALKKALESTTAKEESDEISDQTVLTVLQLFGNDDLAFVVSKAMDSRK